MRTSPWPLLAANYFCIIVPTYRGSGLGLIISDNLCPGQELRLWLVWSSDTVRVNKPKQFIMGSGRADMRSVGRGCWSSLKYKDYLISISSYRMSTAFGSWSPVSTVINLIFIEVELSATKQIPKESLSLGNWNWHWSKILPNSQFSVDGLAIYFLWSSTWSALAKCLTSLVLHLIISNVSSNAGRTTPRLLDWIWLI